MPDLERLTDATLLERWSGLASVRERVLAEIEPLRKDKKIGSSLQAKVVLSASEPEFALLSSYLDQLPMLFIVSEVALERAGSGSGELQVRIERATGVKCDRCWRYVPSVSSAPQSAGLCSRCEGALGL